MTRALLSWRGHNNSTTKWFLNCKLSNSRICDVPAVATKFIPNNLERVLIWVHDVLAIATMHISKWNKYLTLHLTLNLPLLLIQIDNLPFENPRVASVQSAVEEFWSPLDLSLVFFGLITKCRPCSHFPEMGYSGCNNVDSLGLGHWCRFRWAYWRIDYSRKVRPGGSIVIGK